ncbi:MAG: hypothetical protein M3295_00040 [Chloroflexota bacterium]|nr:hypothetical protein [Chloroflexota bacterium]
MRNSRVWLLVGVLAYVVGLTFVVAAALIRVPRSPDPYAVAAYLAVFLGGIVVFEGILRLRGVAVGWFVPVFASLWAYSGLTWSLVLFVTFEPPLGDPLGGLPPLVRVIATGVVQLLVLGGTIFVLWFGVVFRVAVVPYVAYRHLVQRGNGTD